MPWVNPKRHRRALVVDHATEPGRKRISCTAAPLHYESVIDSGNFDTPLDMTPQRVQSASLNGWRVQAAGWHFAYQGFAPTGNQQPQGTLGYGGRQGQNWFLMRPFRVGFLHWPTRSFDAVGGAPTFSAPTVNVKSKAVGIDDADPYVENINVEMEATVAGLWTAGGGSIDWVIKGFGGKLKQDFVIDQPARDAATQYFQNNITTPASENWFCIVFEVDLTDVATLRNGSTDVNQDNDDIEFTNGLHFRDAANRAFGHVQNGEIYVRDRGGRVQIRKRFYKVGGQWYMAIGANVQQMAQNLLPGVLVIDPPITEESITTNSDDALQIGTAMYLSGYQNQELIGEYFSQYHSGWRFQTIPIGTGYSVNSATLEPLRTSSSGATSVTTELYGNDVDDAATFTTTASDITNRARTTASYSITSAEIPANGNRASWDVSGILTELIGRGGWAYDNDIAFVAISSNTDNNYVSFRDYYGSAADACDFNADVSAASGDIAVPVGSATLNEQIPALLFDIGVPAGTVDTDGLLPAISISIGVPAGLLTIDTTGTVPTAEITHTRQIPTVTPLLITPVAPSAEITHIRGPPQGELALTGQLPTIAITISVPVPLGELDLLGLASSANVTHNRAVPAGSASLTGLTETLDTAYGVPADALALAGLLPTISVESGAVVEEPPAGSLALTGLAPDIGGTVTIAVAKGELVIFSGLGLQLRGITPTIAVTGNIVSEPPADTLALTGLQSTAETEHTRQMGAGSLALATLQPSAETEHTRQVPAGSAALTGQLPTISVGVGSATAEPLLGSLTLAGKTPALEIIISNADSSLFFTGQAPTPLQNASPPDIITSPRDGSLTIAGLVPERASGLLLTGLAPTVLGDRQVLPEDGALTLTGLTPTVFGENPTIEVPVGSLSINGLQPSLPDFVAPGTGALTLTGLQPRFEGPQQASPPPDNLVLTGYAPTIVVPTPGKAKAGGRRRGRKPRKFSIEIDGELFVVNTVMEAIDLLRVAKQEAKTAPLPVKKPRIRIVGTASKTARLEVERAQRVVSRTFSKRLDAEIAGLMRESEARQKANTARIKRGMVRAKKRAADDEEAIAVLLLLS